MEYTHDRLRVHGSSVPFYVLFGGPGGFAGATRFDKRIIVDLVVLSPGRGWDRCADLDRTFGEDRRRVNGGLDGFGGFRGLHGDL